MAKIKEINKNASSSTGFSVTYIIIFILLIAFLVYMFFFMRNNNNQINSISEIIRNLFNR